MDGACEGSQTLDPTPAHRLLDLACHPLSLPSSVCLSFSPSISTSLSTFLKPCRELSLNWTEFITGQVSWADFLSPPHPCLGCQFCEMGIIFWSGMT